MANATEAGIEWLEARRGGTSDDYMEIWLAAWIQGEASALKAQQDSKA